MSGGKGTTPTSSTARPTRSPTRRRGHRHGRVEAQLHIRRRGRSRPSRVLPRRRQFNGTGNASKNMIIGNAGDNSSTAATERHDDRRGRQRHLCGGRRRRRGGRARLRHRHDGEDPRSHLHRLRRNRELFLHRRPAFTFTGDGVDNGVSGGNGNDTSTAPMATTRSIGNGGNDTSSAEPATTCSTAASATTR